MKIIEFKNRITDIWDYPKQNVFTSDIDNEGRFFDYLNECGEKKGIRLYIHMPFCNSFCSFCQFYKEPCLKSSDEYNRYFDAVLKELEMYGNSKCMKSRVVTSIFFGGGDPASVSIGYIEKILDKIYKVFTISPDVQITCEGNVRNLLLDNKVSKLRQVGITRISFGIQTFNESLRKKLLLKPTLDEIDLLIDIVRNCFFDKFTFDLMYNLPDQSEEMIFYDIKRVEKIDPEYIDYFNLNLYPNTTFYNSIYKQKKFETIPTKEREYLLQKLIVRELGKLGYNRVISSTFSKKRTEGHFGLVSYLKGGEALGIGPSARGFMSNRLYRNHCSLQKYIVDIEEGKFPLETGTILSEKDISYRRVILQIPLFTIGKEDIIQDEEFKTKLSELVASGYLHENDEKFYVTEEGTYWIGNIQKYLFDEKWAKTDFKGMMSSIKDGRSLYNQDYMSVRGKKGEEWN